MSKIERFKVIHSSNSQTYKAYNEESSDSLKCFRAKLMLLNDIIMLMSQLCILTSTM